MKLCDYGCGKEAKYPFKNGKWCCEDNVKKCPEVKKKNTGYQNFKHTKKWKEEASKRNRGSNNPMYQKNHTQKAKQKISERGKGKIPWNKGKIDVYTKEQLEKMCKAKFGYVPSNKGTPSPNKLTIQCIKEKYPIFTKEEEMRYNVNEEIQVRCKWCYNWFIFTYEQFRSRRDALEHNDGGDGCYFYCSEECKNNCPSFNLRSDPCKNIEKPYTDAEYQVWRQEVLRRDNYKCVGYDGHYCVKPAEHTHHIHPIKTHPELALDPDNGISLCKECHKFIHRAGTSCSNGNLANKIC